MAEKIDYTGYAPGTMLADGTKIAACPVCGKSGRLLMFDSGNGICEHARRIYAPGEGKHTSTEYCWIEAG